MPLDNAPASFDADSNRARGEFVLIVDAPALAEESNLPRAQEAERWLSELVRELPPARAARVVANVTGVARDDLYARAIVLKQQQAD